MNSYNAEWGKLVDKAAEKFHDQVYKAAYQFYGSTSSSETAYLLAAAYATIIKSRDVKEAQSQIFTKEFLAKLSNESQPKRE
jgi:hypothetical protein